MLYLPVGHGRPPLTTAGPTAIDHTAAHPTADGVCRPWITDLAVLIHTLEAHCHPLFARTRARSRKAPHLSCGHDGPGHVLNWQDHAASDIQYHDAAPTTLDSVRSYAAVECVRLLQSEQCRDTRPAVEKQGWTSMQCKKRKRAHTLFSCRKVSRTIASANAHAFDVFPAALVRHSPTLVQVVCMAYSITVARGPMPQLRGVPLSIELDIPDHGSKVSIRVLQDKATA